MPSYKISIQMEPLKRPDNLPIFRIHGFNPSQCDEKKTKQINGSIDCFKIIHACLKEYFNGQVHMYKPISVQLRMLFCDTSRGKDYSLIYRIHPDIRLLAFKKVEYKNSSQGPISCAVLPYVIVERHDGIIYAKLDISPPFRYLHLEEWRNQVVDLQPLLTVKDVIRSVADQDGGAHLDDSECLNLKIMRKHNPTRLGSNVLFIIALAQYVIDFANQIVPIWIRNKDINV